MVSNNSTTSNAAAVFFFFFFFFFSFIYNAAPERSPHGIYYRNRLPSKRKNSKGAWCGPTSVPSKVDLRWHKQIKVHRCDHYGPQRYTGQGPSKPRSERGTTTRPCTKRCLHRSGVAWPPKREPGECPTSQRRLKPRHRDGCIGM